MSSEVETSRRTVAHFHGPPRLRFASLGMTFQPVSTAKSARSREDLDCNKDLVQQRWPKGAAKSPLRLRLSRELALYCHVQLCKRSATDQITRASHFKSKIDVGERT
jgi:hypothetical protein